MKRRAATYQQNNILAARIIAADPARYSGVLQEWARAVLAQQPEPLGPLRLVAEIDHDRPEARERD
jgi:hypothetical protein